jgi:hypothetical protein
MARIKGKDLTKTEIVRLADKTLAGLKHRLSDEQQRILRHRPPEAKAELLLWLDEVDALNERLAAALDGRSIDQLSFLSARHCRALSAVPYSADLARCKQAREAMEALEEHDRKVEATPVEELLTQLTAPGSRFTTHPPRAPREKTHPERTFPWETARELAGKVTVTPYVPPAAPAKVVSDDKQSGKRQGKGKSHRRVAA